MFPQEVPPPPQPFYPHLLLLHPLVHSSQPNVEFISSTLGDPHPRDFPRQSRFGHQVHLPRPLGLHSPKPFSWACSFLELSLEEVLPLDPPSPPTLKNGLPYKNRPNLMNSSSLFIIGYSNCTSMVEGCTQSFFVHYIPIPLFIAGQSSLVARKAHNLEVSGSNLVSTKFFVKKWRVKTLTHLQNLFLIPHVKMKPNQDLDSLTSSLSLYKLPFRLHTLFNFFENNGLHFKLSDYLKP